MFVFSKEKIQSFTTTSPTDTIRLGEVFGALLTKGSVVAYVGGMGMGKTTFTIGVAKGVGSTSDVSSPTFSILSEYKGGRFPLCHIDAYRLSSGEDLDSIGYYDYIDSGATALIEWSERLDGYLDEITCIVEFQKLDDNTRIITFYFNT